MARLTFRNCELDIGRRTLHRGGAPVAVEPRVFDLVVYLVRNRHRVVSRSELLAALWPGLAVTPAALDRAVQKARRALGDCGDLQRIVQTSRCRGFRFVADVEASVSAFERSVSRRGDFVGRGRELRALRAGLREAIAGKGGAFLIEGERGSGKSRLVGEIAGEATLMGAEVRVACCGEEQLETAAGPWRRILGGLLPELSVPRALAPGLAIPLELARRSLRYATEVQPLVVVLEDLERADLPTLLLLRPLAADSSGHALLFLGTCRGEELEADPARASLVAKFARCASATTLRLGGLSVEEIRRLLELRTGSASSVDCAARLWKKTGGNPASILRRLPLAIENETPERMPSRAPRRLRSASSA